MRQKYGIPKKHRGRRKMGSKKRRARKKKKKNIKFSCKMDKIKTENPVCIWIFLVPFISNKYMFIISQNFEFQSTI